MSVLAVDVGTSGVRAAVVRPDSSVVNVHQRHVLPSSPMQGFVEFDAAAIAKAVLEVSNAAMEGNEDVEAVGISTQRASTVVWHRATGEPVAPGLGWQDLRTVGFCLALQAQGIRLAPNQSATKLAVLRLVRRHCRFVRDLDAHKRRSARVRSNQPCCHRPARR